MGGAAIPHAALALTQLGDVAIEAQVELRVLLQVHPLQADGCARRGGLQLRFGSGVWSWGWRPLVTAGGNVGGVGAGFGTC